MDAIVSVISTLGFPIACVIALGLFIKEVYNNMAVTNKEREEKLYTIIAENQKQLNELSNTNASFVEILNQFKNELHDISEDVENIKDVIGRS